MTGQTGELVLLCDDCLARIRGVTRGPTLRERRAALGYSLRDLERLVGIHRARLSAIEHGITPTADELGRLEPILAPPAA